MMFAGRIINPDRVGLKILEVELEHLGSKYDDRNPVYPPCRLWKRSDNNLRLLCLGYT